VDVHQVLDPFVVGVPCLPRAGVVHLAVRELQRAR